MKFTGVLAAVVGVVGLSAVSAFAAPVGINFTVVANEAAHTWDAFAQVTGDTSRTQGLAGASVSVVGTGGVVVTSSTNRMPLGLNGFAIGFAVQRSGGLAGIALEGAQSNSYQTGTADDGNEGVNNVLLNVGMAPGPQFGITYANPVRIGSGNYTGDIGALTISSSGTLTTLLPAVMPTPTTGGVNFSTFSPDFVNGQTTTIGTIVPEPASLSLLGLGAVALLTRRRKA